MVFLSPCQPDREFSGGGRLQDGGPAGLFVVGILLFLRAGAGDYLVFALAWQQILKHMSLTFAFTNKPITILWGLLWGVVFFGETMTWNKILGSVVILAGIMIGVSGNDRTEQSE